MLANYELARAAYVEALRLSTETTSLPGIGSALLVGSAVESSAGQHRSAVRMVAATIALSERFGAGTPEMPMIVDEVEDAARQAIGSEAVEAILAEGVQMTPEAVVAYATSLCAMTA